MEEANVGKYKANTQNACQKNDTTQHAQENGEHIMFLSQDGVQHVAPGVGMLFFREQGSWTELMLGWVELNTW